MFRDSEDKNKHGGDALDYQEDLKNIMNNMNAIMNAVKVEHDLTSR